MYSKLKKEDVLDHFVRGQIYGLIRLQPGAHYNFIKQKLDLKNGVLSYHLSTLEREGYVLSEMDGIYRRFYPNSVKFEVDYPIFLSKLQERIVDFIKSRPGLTQKEVAKELGISTSTANDNIQVLSQALILALKRDGKRTRCYLVES
jgi:predicted transcriptional regulator